MTRSTALRVAALVATGALALTACGGSGHGSHDDGAPAASGSPAAPAPLQLSAVADASPAAAKIGPIAIGVLLATPYVEGGESGLGAEGAEVAAYRLGLGGVRVTLTVRTDDGTAAGALKAMKGLMNAGVAGVVVASSGPHLRQALAAASGHVPVLLPYDGTATGLAGVWNTGPTDAEADQALVAAMKQAGVSSPYVVDADGMEMEGRVGAAGSPVELDDPTKTAKRIAADAAQGRVDGVLIAATAATQAKVAGALQEALGDHVLPVFLTPDALSPAFGQALAAHGSTGGSYTTVGGASGDVLALSGGSAGSAAAAFFSALRLAASQPSLKDLYGDAPFTADAAEADTASHDAVVALVRAAQAADSTDPGRVAAALGSLTLGPAQGLAGAPLDFSSAAALPAQEVVALQATDQDPGLRPAGKRAPALFWFSTRTQ